jgi:hypothetical protein
MAVLRESNAVEMLGRYEAIRIRVAPQGGAAREPGRKSGLALIVSVLERGRSVECDKGFRRSVLSSFIDTHWEERS